jgi:hypothetical protein
MSSRLWIRFATIALSAILVFLVWQRGPTREVTPAARGRAGGAAGATAVAGGRRDLAWDEQRGGHTLSRHVGRGEKELAERLEREGGIAAASSFVDRPTAERVVGHTLASNQDRVASWLRRDRENLTLDYRGTAEQTIGWVLLRGESRPLAARDARVVLRKRGGQYFVLTSYPVEP